MNIALNNIAVAAIYYQWIKETKDMVMGYAKKLFVEQMYWLYVGYGQIIPVDLINKQDTMQVTYHVK